MTTVGGRGPGLLKGLGLALLSAAMVGAYARFPAAAFLPYVSLVPWVVLYTDPRRPKPSHLHYAFSVWVAWILQYQQTWKYGWFAPPIMGLFFIPPFWAFTPVLRRAHFGWNLPRALTVPVVWTAIEWLRATFALAHFDLYGLGYSQARFAPLIQIADVTGVYGLSFLVAAVNGWLADLYFAWREGGFRWRGIAQPRRLVRSAAAIAAAFVAVLAYGAWRLASASSEPGPRLAVVQPNIRHTLRNAVGVHLGQVLQTERDVPAGAADLIVWPENAVLDDIRRPGAYIVDLAWLAQRKQAPLLVGAMAPSERKPGRPTNAAVLVDAAGAIVGRYDKQLLFPWSEYPPWDEAFAAISTRLQRALRVLIRVAWGWLPFGDHGVGMNLLELPWKGGTLPFAALICIENTYPPIPAEAGRRGARFFVNITSEGEVGGVVQEQLLRICIMRAVENRIAYVRCGNTGISGFIDPNGRVKSILTGARGGTVSVAGTLIDEVPLSRGGTTPYGRSRDAFALLCVAASVALFLGGFARTRRLLRGGAAALAAAAAILATGCSGPLAPGDDAGIAPRALQAARRALESGDRAAAASAAARACGDEAACAEALPVAFQALLGSLRIEDAADFFDSAAAKWPALAGDAHAYAGLFLERSGDFPGAEACYRDAVKAAPTPAHWALLGGLLLKVNRPKEAVEAYRETVRAAPDEPRGRYGLARALRNSADAARSREILEKLVADRPDQADAWALLGSIRLEQDDVAGARDALERALAADPKHLEARLFLARIALRGGDLEEAERIRREVAEIEAGLGRGPREE